MHSCNHVVFNLKVSLAAEFVACSRHSVNCGNCEPARRASGTGKKAKGLARDSLALAARLSV